MLTEPCYFQLSETLTFDDSITDLMVFRSPEGALGPPKTEKEAEKTEAR